MGGGDAQGRGMSFQLPQLVGLKSKLALIVVQRFSKDFVSFLFTKNQQKENNDYLVRSIPEIRKLNIDLILSTSL